MNIWHISYSPLIAGVMGITGLGMFASAPLLAQNTASNQGSVSREIVQPLPSADVQRLNTALRRLSRNSRDMSALTDAGKAALALGDLEAAMGFFGRAQDLSPSNPSVKMGIAAVFLRSDRPIEALRLFSEAEAAGASSNAVAAERGLAFDLVGNNAQAQASYLVALERGAGSAVQRRLAISHAIAGNKEDFEIILEPLVASRDFAAFRARAFGLAILGEAGEANAIADAVMPRDLAARMAPYFDYMPRLTKSQQAAAANLGIFPKAAEIGRDDPRIAQYSGSTSVAGADARLAPQGTPLGRANTDPRRRRPDRTGAGSSFAAASVPAAAASIAPSVLTPTPTPALNPAPALQPVQTAASNVPAVTASPGQGTGELPAIAETALAAAAPVAAPAAVPVASPVAAPAAASVTAAPIAGPQIMAASTPAIPTPSASTFAAVDQSAPAPSITTFVSNPVEQAVDQVAGSNPDQATAVIAAPQRAIPDVAEVVTPATANVVPADAKPLPSATTFDLPKVAQAMVEPSAAQSVAPPSGPQAPALAATAIEEVAAPVVQAVPEPRQRVADAFADFASEGRTSVTPAAGAVDISALSVKREIEEAPAAKTESKPAEPAHPKRFWVQIATGQDRAALKFDYRRIARNSGDLLKNYAGHVAEWGETNRLVAGPVASSKSAQALVTALKEKGVDSFTFTSPDGKEVTEIK